MKRVEGWETRLNDFIESRHNTRFQWGIHDCALFSWTAVEVITGIDLAHWCRGKYRNKAGAYKLLQNYSNGGGLEETAEKLAKQFELKEIESSFAGRGDVVMCNVPTAINEELPTLGVIGMSGKIYIPGTRRLQIFEKENGVRFWKV
jgi:hypothetical protein